MIVYIFLAKLIGFLLRLFRIGGGTSLPGLFIEKYLPHSISNLSRKYKKIVLITGTNGKTTTQKLLHHLLVSSDLRVASNRSGANLFRGIATTIVNDCSIFGKVRSDIGVFEVEEATMPIITKYLKPDYIIVTNLFRDQLDAYGEVLKTRKYILDSAKKCPDAKVVLNADDGNVVSMANQIENKEIFGFSVDDERSKKIFYERRYFPEKLMRKMKTFTAKSIKVNSDLSTTFNISSSEKTISNLTFSSPGVHYIYNALAAIITAMDIQKITPDDLRTFLTNFSPAFGRGEIINIDTKKIRIILIKNPASFSANLNLLANQINLKLLIAINDNIADGRDISWLWDSKLEVLKDDNVTWITTSGKRALDMNLRLKYSGIGSRKIIVEPNMRKAFDIALAQLRDGETLFILPTYTAMLDVRKVIGNFVNVRPFWT